MKKIFAIFTLAFAFILPSFAQLAPVALEVAQTQQRKLMRRTIAATDITFDDLMGTFQVHAMSAFEGYPDEEWPMQFSADPVEANKLWITPIMQIPGISTSEIFSVYAYYDQEEATITLPLGQSIYGGAGQQYNLVIATVDEEYNPLTEGEVKFNVSGKPDDITIEFDFILGVGNLEGNEWWYNALSSIVITRKMPDPLVYIVCKDGKSIGLRTEQLFFAQVDNEVCVTNTKEISSSSLIGTYTAHANSAFQGSPDEEWTLEITYDEDDQSKVWIHPIVNFGSLSASEILPIYANYYPEQNSLVIPLGQVLYGAEDDEQFCFVLGSADNEYNPVTTGNLVLNVESSSRGTTIEIPYILGVGNLKEGADGWWYQALGYTVLSRNTGILATLSEVDVITRQMPTPEIDGLFDNGEYYWQFQISEDGTTYDEFTTKTTHSYQGDIDMGMFYPAATGVIAHKWSIAGFMEDLGYFTQGGESKAFPAYSYKYEVDGVETEFVEMLDAEKGLISIGYITLTGQDGVEFVTDIYWGEYDGNNLYTNLQFVVENNVAHYNGVSAVLWFLKDDQPYLLADFKDLIIFNDQAKGTPAKTQINILPQPVPVKLAGIKEMQFRK